MRTQSPWPNERNLKGFGGSFTARNYILKTGGAMAMPFDPSLILPTN